MYLDTVFENRPKHLIQHCERSELRLHFEWKNSIAFWRIFEKVACGQTVLPDKSVLIGQN